MRLLLDTHFPLWLATDSSKLSAAERSMLDDRSNELVVSAVSIWELRLKWNSVYVSGDRKGLADPAAVSTVMAEFGCVSLALTAAHAAVILATPIAHRDPFDELLLAQAQVEGLRLLTRDRVLLAHPLAIGV